MYDDERSERAQDGRRPGVRGEPLEPALVTPDLIRQERRGRRPGRVGFDPVGSNREAPDRGAGARPRRAPGPRPVRPAGAPTSVRPAQGERPGVRVDPALRVCPNRQRVVPRTAPAVPRSTAGPGRRLLAGLLVLVTAALVVVGLGQLLALGGAASAASAPTGPAAVRTAGQLVTVRDEHTVWDVARRIDPAADGADRTALAERIVVANALTSVELRPGQVLRVPSG